MASRIKPTDQPIKIKFGGGLHTRASADEIDAREAAAGKNFILDLDNRELRNRAPFDLIGTVPNAGQIRGGGSLLKSDGTVSTLFQAAGIVYEWDGGTGFNAVGTCDSSSRLRGHWRSHNVALNDKLLLTDLELASPVKEWNGTTFASVAFTKEDEAAFGTSFFAKYVSVNNERAVFANVVAGSATPHLIVGSKREDYTEISIAQRPSSALSDEDPFFIPMPDLKPINGMQEAFGTTIVSTEKGRLFNLSGSSAKDFAIGEFFAGSSASGEESLSYIGTDIIYGRQGRIESVRDTNNFGNSEADDLTLEIADQIENFTGWTNVYNGRANRVYMFPEEQSQLWVFNPAMRTARQLSAGVTNQFIEQSQVQQTIGKLSPWMKWQTTHPMAFMPTFVMSMLDPSDGLEYVFMGDASGNIYRMEGTGDTDGGSAAVDLSWTTKVFSAPLDASEYKLEGFIKYKKAGSATVTLTFLCAGLTAFDVPVTINIPAIPGIYFGGTNYFGGHFYFGAAFADRLIRQIFVPPGQMEDFQIRVDSSNDIDINEIDIRLIASK